MKKIACIHTDLSEKFGVPRQSGLCNGLKGTIVFESEYNHPSSVKGLEEFSHIWLLWEFSKNKRKKWSATVRPPRLGGSVHVGVYATRASYRPNPIGLSCVKLERIEYGDKGPVLYVSGIDMIDGTPIFDIKPYVPVSDCHPEATESYTAITKKYSIDVDIPEELLQEIPEDKREGLMNVLMQDPRPRYGSEEERIYGMTYGDYNIKFQVIENCAVVRTIEKHRD